MVLNYIQEAALFKDLSVKSLCFPQILKSDQFAGAVKYAMLNNFSFTVIIICKTCVKVADTSIGALLL